MDVWWKWNASSDLILIPLKGWKSLVKVNAHVERLRSPRLPPGWPKVVSSVPSCARCMLYNGIVTIKSTCAYMWCQKQQCIPLMVMEPCGLARLVDGRPSSLGSSTWRSVYLSTICPNERVISLLCVAAVHASSQKSQLIFFQLKTNLIGLYLVLTP